MREIGGIMRLRAQPKQLGLLGGAQVPAQRLDGHGTSQLDVVAFPYLTHAALRKTGVQPVTLVDELSFNQFHSASASCIMAFIIGPAAYEP